MLVVLAVLMLWNRGCTAFLTHETLTPHARSRVLYYSLVQVCQGGEMEEVSFVVVREECLFS